MNHKLNAVTDGQGCKYVINYFSYLTAWLRGRKRGLRVLRNSVHVHGIVIYNCHLHVEWDGVEQTGHSPRGLSSECCTWFVDDLDDVDVTTLSHKFKTSSLCLTCWRSRLRRYVWIDIAMIAIRRLLAPVSVAAICITDSIQKTRGRKRNGGHWSRILSCSATMWWEIIPSAAVIGAVLWTVPTINEQVAKALYNTVSSIGTRLRAGPHATPAYLGRENVDPCLLIHILMKNRLPYIQDDKNVK